MTADIRNVVVDRDITIRRKQADVQKMVLLLCLAGSDNSRGHAGNLLLTLHISVSL